MKQDSETNRNSRIDLNKPDDKYIREVIFGSLLGDGYLEMAPRAKNARFIFSPAYAAPKYEEYFMALYLMFFDYCSNTFQKYEHLDSRTNKTYITYSFKTKSLAALAR